MGKQLIVNRLAMRMLILSVGLLCTVVQISAWHMNTHFKRYKSYKNANCTNFERMGLTICQLLTQIIKMDHYNYNHVKGECCLIYDGTDVDSGAKLMNPDPVTNLTTYLKIWEDEGEEEALFRGRDSVMNMLMNMLPPHVVQTLLG